MLFYFQLDYYNYFTISVFISHVSFFMACMYYITIQINVII